MTLYNPLMSKTSRILSIVAMGIMSICIFVFFLTASIACAVNSPWLYKYGFNKYNIGETTGLSEHELNKAAKGLISYFNSGEEFINVTVEKEGKTFTLFNEREVMHLKDVKGLFRLDYIVLLCTFVYGLVYTLITIYWRNGIYRRTLAWGIVGGGGVTLVLMLVLGLGILTNFDQLFLRFHLLSFANDLWRLDPAKDYLIMLFPRDFWYDAALFCALGTLAAAVISGTAAGVYLYITRHKLIPDENI
jgi:integral membrane protein (TIGR01906 family)